MSLSHKQKKQLKSLTPKYSLSEVSDKLNLDKDEVKTYLQKKWSKEKYTKYISSSNNNSNLKSTSNFGNFLWEERLVLLFLTVLIFVIYANVLSAEFVSDDILGLVNNPDVGKISQIGSSPHILGRQVYNFLFINLFGLTSSVFRVGNILFHIGSSFLLYLIVKLLSSKKAGIIASIIFAVHPVAIESVTWISGGVYPQYTFFFLLSFFVYLLSKNKPKYFKYSLLAFLVSLLSSEKAIVLPLVFVLYEFLFGNIRQNWQKVGSFVGFAVVWVVFVFGFAGALRQRTTDLTTFHYGEGGFYNPLIQIPAAISTYLELTLWPADLTLYHSELAFGQIEYVVRIFVTLLIFVAYLYSYFKNKVIFFFLSITFVSLLPSLTPLKIAWVVAERYFYLGLGGLVAAISILFVNLFKKLDSNILYFVLAIVAVLLSVRTVDRNMDWQTADKLWIATAKTSPSDPKTHNNLGDVYSREGDYKMAESEFELATKLNPNYADAYHNLGLTQYKMGEFEKAISNFQKALEIRPNLWQSHAQLAQIYYEQEFFSAAFEHVNKALEIDPKNQNLLQARELLQINIE